MQLPNHCYFDRLAIEISPLLMTGRKLTIGEIFRQGSEAWALMVFQQLRLDFETKRNLKLHWLVYYIQVVTRNNLHVTRIAYGIALWTKLFFLSRWNFQIFRIFIILNFVKPHKISSIYLDKQKSFVPNAIPYAILVTWRLLRVDPYPSLWSLGTYSRYQFTRNNLYTIWTSLVPTVHDCSIDVKCSPNPPSFHL